MIQNESRLNEGDIVINNSLYLATMVGKSNVGKILTLNYTKLEFSNDGHSKEYFYLQVVEIPREQEELRLT
ncbi:hypothetical protein [Carnobacterium maltaromaticum]|uniref:hypothetical protein n=1 Tax=Carnobacterium maltaromaticum TaxID=2751 RepID=UPI00026C8AF4|nr:hypothetical protein [Carnobacterium maltaromaticum]